MRVLAFALLKAAAGKDLAGGIAGDLEEVRRRRATRSVVVAEAWFWGASLAIAISAASRRVADAAVRMVSGGFGLREPGIWRRAVRSLRHSPWYSLTVIGVIALALALATTVFAVVDGVLFKPLPYTRVAELYQLSGDFSAETLRKSRPGMTMAGARFSLSARDVADLAAALPRAQFAMYAFRAPANEQVGDLRSWIPVVGEVDEHFFDVLGVHPLLGGFASQDFDGASRGVVPALVTYALWQRQLNGRVDAIGQTLTTGDATPAIYRVAGILPAGFVFPTSGANPPNILVPLSLTPAQRADRRNKSGYAIARLPPDVPLTDAQERINAAAKAGALEIFDARRNGGLGYGDIINMRSLDADLRGRQRPTLWTIFGASLALVILACVNVSGLMASRSVDRARELMLRRALGAGTRQIAALVLVECAVLIAAGTIVGVALARPALSLALRLLPANLGLLKTPGLDWRVLTFAVGATALAILLVSIWPIAQSLRVRLSPTLSASGHGATATRSIGRHIVIGLQTALGLALTLGGVLLVSSLMQVWRTDIGFSPGHLLVVDGTVTAGLSAADRTAALAEFLDALRAVPGVTAAGATGAQLLRNSAPGGMFRGGNTYRVTRGFFDAMQSRVIEGRLPTAIELDGSAPVLVVSQRVARSLFPGQSAVGQAIAAPDGQSFAVIGVVADVRVASWDTIGSFGGEIYAPLAGANAFTAVVRTATGESLLPVLLRLAGDRPASMRLSRMATADDLLVDTIRQRRFQSWLFGSFAAAAITIVGVGILGLIAMATARRRREIGVRMALGASRDAVIRLLLREQLVGVVMGLVTGGLLSAWAVTFVKSYLYQVAPSDPRVWAAAVGLILIMACAGALIPSIRASRIEPVTALRVE